MTMNSKETPLLARKSYLHIICKECKSSLTNIKQAIKELPLKLILPSFYLKNLKFSSKIRISQDQSYGFNKCKCINCKAHVGRYVVIGSPSTSHLISSVMINKDKVEVKVVESDEDLLNTRSESILVGANKQKQLDKNLAMHFNSKFDKMNHQIGSVENTLSMLINKMRDRMKELIAIKECLLAFFVQIVKNKNKEEGEAFMKLISEKNQKEISLPLLKTTGKTKRKSKREQSLSNGKKKRKGKKIKKDKSVKSKAQEAKKVTEES